MDRPHKEVILDQLLLGFAVLHQFFNDRNQETLIVFPIDIPDIGISTISECLESKVSIKRVRENDTGDQSILGADLPKDPEEGRITWIFMENNDIVPGQGFPKVCRSR